MRFIPITFMALITVLGVRPAGAQTLYTCGDGTVSRVQTIMEMVAGRPVVSVADLGGEPVEHVQMSPAEPRPAYIVSVRLFDVTYIAEAFTNATENFDPTGLAENEVVSVCVNRDRMILDRRDGSDFRANIVRTEHVRQPKGTSR